MATTSDHKSALATLLRNHQERGEPFAFAGREDVIERIIATARQNYKKPIPGATFLISGAPGAGKTSLVREILKQWHAHTSPAESIFCKSVPHEREAVGHLWTQLTAKLTGKSLEELRRRTQKTTSRDLGMNKVFKFRKGSQESESLENLGVWSTEMLSEHAPETGYVAPAIFVIDEVQGARIDTSMSGMIRDLHAQADIPVLMVCAGLATSRMRLDEAKAISADRMNTKNNVISLGMLTREEAKKAVKGGLKRIADVAGVNDERLHEMFTEELTERSDQWPRHITCYLHGVAEALIEQDTPDLNTLDKSRVLALGDQERKDYYQSRVNSSRLPVDMIHSLYKEVGKGRLHEGDASGLLKVYLRNDQSPRGIDLREKFETEGVTPFEKALHAGLITLNQDMECEIPIPSMETYIEARYEELNKGHEDIIR